MITIPQTIVAEMFEQARAEAPVECCGYLGSLNNVVTKRYQMTNVDNSPEHFSFDPKEQFKVLKEVRNEGVALSCVYHIHPESPARLSQEDLRLANDPNIVYIIVSLFENREDVKGFKVKKNGTDIAIESVPLTITK